MEIVRNIAVVYYARLDCIPRLTRRASPDSTLSPPAIHCRELRVSFPFGVSTAGSVPDIGRYLSSQLPPTFSTRSKPEMIYSKEPSRGGEIYTSSTLRAIGNLVSVTENMTVETTGYGTAWN